MMPVGRTSTGHQLRMYRNAEIYRLLVEIAFLNALKSTVSRGRPVSRNGCNGSPICRLSDWPAISVGV